MNLLLIGLGGSLGAISRYLINELFIKFIPTEYPLGILFINVIGCFFIGFYFGTNLIIRDGQYYLFIVGFIGSFTTMSAFTHQTINMLNTNILMASSYIIATIILTIAATYFGANFLNK
jgi:fluoride exporter